MLGGLVAILSWGASFGLVRAGTLEGLTPADFVLLRFGLPALLTAPLVFVRRESLIAIGPWKGVTLTLVAGPAFVLLSAAGFAYAPLAHGAVVQPSTVAIGGMLAGTFLFREPLTARKALGTGMVFGGILLVGGSALATGTGSSWIGDLLFAAAGALWVAFTLLVRRWRIDPLAGTIVVSLLSAVFVIPIYGLWIGPARLLALSAPTLVAQILVQGVLAGIVAIVGYAYSVRQLGVGRAALFPALVPAATVLMGIPLTGERPNGAQIVGLALATAGLLVAVVARPNRTADIPPGAVRLKEQAANSKRNAAA